MEDRIMKKNTKKLDEKELEQVNGGGRDDGWANSHDFASSSGEDLPRTCTTGPGVSTAC